MSDSPSPSSRPRRFRRLGKILLWLLVLIVVAGLAGGLWVRSRLRASLPQVSGEQRLAGLAAPVRLERDALGVVTIRGADRLDAARALGWAHAQDRFFQMDLARRNSAGELSELLGPRALPRDREHRLHRFRHRAAAQLARSGAGEKALLAAYAAGVNAGLAALGAPPFEYLLLRARPAPWKPEDSFLIGYTMFFLLQDSAGRRESDLGLMRDLLPPDLAAFLAPGGTEWDAPLLGGATAMPPMPGPDTVDLRRQPPTEINPRALPQAATLEKEEAEEARAAVGSNSWAVAGSQTADGRAWFANDMHLPLSVPNIWYRASLVWPAEDGSGERRVTGVTLAGIPVVVAGSNGHVAWGFTNSYGDWSDLIELETEAQRPNLYRVPGGVQRIATATETIRVKGRPAVTLEVPETIWGPVLGPDHRGRLRAFAWTAHHPDAVSFGMTGLESARTVDEALAVAHRSGVPAQNFVVADESGRIAWTVIGRVPRRIGFDGRVPTSWADGSRRWDGWLNPDEVPQVVDPVSGRLWTANARTMDGEALARLGDGGYDLGARASQIRDGLLALDRATPEALLALQLDDRALFLERWRKLLLATLTAEAMKGHPARAALKELVEKGWTGRASIDSGGYWAVRAFRTILEGETFAALTAPCTKADAGFVGPKPQLEGPLWELVTRRPPHLLNALYKTWDEQLLHAADRAIFRMRGAGSELADRTWGERNTVRIRHPLAAAIPLVGNRLNMAVRPLPGDANMPRVQGPDFGASERLVVSPGQEEKGFFHMPGGQSGHPLSPHYRDGFAAWAEGKPTPFLPGPTVDTLTLKP